MVTYVVRLKWPAARTPELEPDDLVARLWEHHPIVEPGVVVVDGIGVPWSVTVCSEGTTPRLAAMNALGLVEPVLGIRVTGFEVLSSTGCEQIADPDDAVPELIDDASIARLLGEDHGPLAELTRRDDFPPVVVETRHGPLRDLHEVQAWARHRT